MMDSPTLRSADKVESLAVLGAGTMGSGIAHIAALAGISVQLFDLDDDVLASAMSRIRANLDKGVDRGKIGSEQRDAALDSIQTTTRMEKALEGAHAVIEAVPESLDLKRQVFATIVESAPSDALLATNTSSLSIEKIADAGDPGRVVGMHFFNPVHIMKLVEIVRHDEAQGDAVACAHGLATRMGKTPIVVKDAPGFASSRLGLVLGLEAMRMLESDVASARDIDTAMKLGYGHPMGPLELTDLVGLDVRLKIAEYLATEIGQHFTPPKILKDLVAEGKLGKKSGVGFYRWVDGRPMADDDSEREQ